MRRSGRTKKQSEFLRRGGRRFRSAPCHVLYLKRYYCCCLSGRIARSDYYNIFIDGSGLNEKTCFLGRRFQCEKTGLSGIKRNESYHAQSSVPASGHRISWQFLRGQVRSIPFQRRGSIGIRSSFVGSSNYILNCVFSHYFQQGYYQRRFSVSDYIAYLNSGNICQKGWSARQKNMSRDPKSSLSRKFKL